MDKFFHVKFSSLNIYGNVYGLLNTFLIGTFEPAACFTIFYILFGFGFFLVALFIASYVSHFIRVHEYHFWKEHIFPNGMEIHSVACLLRKMLCNEIVWNKRENRIILRICRISKGSEGRQLVFCILCFFADKYQLRWHHISVRQKKWQRISWKKS